MEIIFSNVLIFFLPFVFFIINLLLHKLPFRSDNNLPPSPQSLPIIGHLRRLRGPIHRILCDLSNTYGPVFSLILGSLPVIIVSSFEVAEECFTKNDIVLANCIPPIVGQYLGYENVVTTNYGDIWRNLRRISTIEFFSPRRINTLVSIQKNEVRRLLHNISNTCNSSIEKFTRININSELTELMFNIMMRMLIGKRYEEMQEFKKDVDELLFRLIRDSAPGELFPFLRWINYGGTHKRIIRLYEKIDTCLQGLIDEHQRKKLDGSEIKDTMLDNLVNLQDTEPEHCLDQIIKGFILVFMLAETETTSSEIERALSYLVNNPNILDKAKIEINALVGQDLLINKLDISKLPYLLNIIAETLRLKLATPQLLPHCPSEDCRIGGYHVPSGTMVLVNVWAIHRDPTLLDDPKTFRPERFEGNARMQDKDTNKLSLPFGLGRRSCPDMTLAHRLMGLTLGSLILCFDLKSIGEEPVDMKEDLGMTMTKKVPLELMCKVRPGMRKLLF